MAQVYIVASETKPLTWSLYRIGTGRGRLEWKGFKTAHEARMFARMWGHEVVALTAKVG